MISVEKIDALIRRWDGGNKSDMVQAFELARWALSEGIPLVRTDVDSITCNCYDSTNNVQELLDRALAALPEEFRALARERVQS